MTDVHKLNLRKYRTALVANMDINAMMNHIVSDAVLNDRDIDTINSKSTKSEKIECFLNALSIRPDPEYKKFIEILKKTSQQHLAKLLEKSEEVSNSGLAEQSASASGK